MTQTSTHVSCVELTNKGEISRVGGCSPQIARPLLTKSVLHPPTCA